MKNRYFKVVTKCGHVGRYHCIWIEFAIVAESKQQAADKVREEGRVKRDHKDFIKEIKEISSIFLQNENANSSITVTPSGISKEMSFLP